MEDYKEIIEKIKPELEKVISFLEKEINSIRAGRATPSLVENIIVDCCNEKFPLKQLAAISTPSQRDLLIQPWDKSYLDSIEKALSQSNIGASPIIDKDVIRLTMPSLNEEYRKKLLLLLSEKQEEARITIRRWREEAWKNIQEGFRSGEIREDDKFRAKDKLQELIDEYNKKVKEMGERKKQEIEN